MSSNPILTMKLATLLFGVIVLLLSACGGGGGSDGGDTSQINLQGLAAKGPIAQGTINVYLLNQDGTRGTTPIASTTTDQNGNYQIHIPVLVDSPVAIVLTGGSYVDEATGNVVSLRQVDQLETYTYVPANGNLTAQITPLTTLAAALARRHRTMDGQSLSNSIPNANNEISNLFGVGNILNVSPPAISQVAISTPEQRNYSLFLAGFSQLAQEASKNVFDIVASMATDLESNGVLGNSDPSISPSKLVLATQDFIQDHGNGSNTSLSAQSVANLSTDTANPSTIYTASTTNSPPVANDASIITDEDTVFTGLLDGTDANSTDILKFTIISNGAKGNAVITDQNTGSFTYTPDPNKNGTDSFTYLLSDGISGDYGTVTIAINPVNDAPQADDLSVTTNEDRAVSGNLHASDIENDPLSYSIVTDGNKGSVRITNASTGAFTYTPITNANGVDTFTYQVDDGKPVNNLSNIATVTVTINPVNDPPTIDLQNLSTNEDVQKTITLTGSDVDTATRLSFAVTVNPFHGSLGAIGTPVCGGALPNNCTAQVTYTPNLNYNGSDSFTFTVNDGTASSAPATVSITIDSVNDPPVITSTPGLGATQNVLYQYRVTAVDPDVGDALTYSLTTAPTGMSIDSSTGLIQWTPASADKGTTVDVTVVVTDNGTNPGPLSTTQSFQIAVDPPVMVIVAHPDEESLIAAGVMKEAMNGGNSVKVVIVTNGDSASDGLTREAESMDALVNKLGLDQNDLIFLGYPDAGLLDMYNNYPTAADGSYVSLAGKSATYGGLGLGGRDFHSYRNGTAAAYNRANLVADLKALMDRYQPAEIHTNSPADQDSDDRAVFYAVRDAIQSLTQAQAHFRPEVNITPIHDSKDYPYTDKWLKGTATTPAADLSADAYWPNPAFAGTAGNLADMLARFTPGDAFNEPQYLFKTPFLWGDRIRMAVPAAMQDANLAANLKFQMLDSYVSQQTGDGLIYAFGKNEEIFWQVPWSRNIALSASIMASSENTANFQQASNVADGISDGAPGNSQVEWTTQGEAAGAWIHMAWNQAHTIDQVVLFDRPNANDQILSGTLMFSDGTSLPVTPANGLPNDGKPYTVTLSLPKTVTWVRFVVDAVSATTTNVGLSEMQVMEAQPSVLDHPPFFTRGPWANSYALTAGATTRISAQAYDGDGDVLTYSWRSQLGGIITGSGPTVTYQAPAAISSGPDIITVTVTDGVNEPITAQFAIH